MAVAVSVNPTRLRENLYGILDQVLDTGIAVSVERKGRVLTISAQPVGSRLALLKAHPGTVAGSKDELVSIDWSADWNPGV
jgi:hypothetical protein